MHLQARIPLQLEHEIFGVFRDIYYGRHTILSEEGSGVVIKNGEVHVPDEIDLSIRDADFEEKVVDLCEVTCQNPDKMLSQPQRQDQRMSMPALKLSQAESLGHATTESVR